MWARWWVGMVVSWWVGMVVSWWVGMVVSWWVGNWDCKCVVLGKIVKSKWLHGK